MKTSMEVWLVVFLNFYKILLTTCKNPQLLLETPFADLEGAIVKSKNPVFKNIVDYLVEEENAEEELLLGFSDKPEEIAKSPFEVDQKFISALDRLILYLRIVHSVDYYNSCEYANEDTMPHRFSFS
jgi:hypothetical protein